MTQLAMFMNPTQATECEHAQCTPEGLAAYVTATVVYSLSGATIFLLATFIRSI